MELKGEEGIVLKGWEVMEVMGWEVMGWEVMEVMGLGVMVLAGQRRSTDDGRTNHSRTLAVSVVNGEGPTCRSARRC